MLESSRVVRATNQLFVFLHRRQVPQLFVTSLGVFGVDLKTRRWPLPTFAAPVGPIVGGVAVVLVIIAIIVAVAMKTGRLKSCRHSNTGPTPAVPVEPVHHTAPVQQYPSQSGRPSTQYPVAHQYPAPI